MSSFSYSTPMTNPYTNKAISAEGVLKNLVKSRGSAPALAVVQSVHEQLIRKELDWSLDLALDFSSYVISILDPQVSSSSAFPEGSVATLQLLTAAMENWPDNLLYATLVQDSDAKCSSKNLWELLIKLSLSEQPLHITALMGVSTASRAFERLQQVTSLDSNSPDFAWWFTKENSKDIARLALNLLISGLDESTPQLSSTITSILSFPTYEEIKIAATSILSDLLRHKNTVWLESSTEEELKVLCLQLTTESQVLINNQLPPGFSDSTLSLAILSTTLLSLLQWKSNIDLAEFNGTIQTTALVENIVSFVFPSTQGGYYSHGPSWTHESRFEQCHQYALDLIYSWKLCAGNAWSVFTKQENHWGPFFENSWESILLDQSPPDVGKILPKLFLLHIACQIAARTRLTQVIKRLAEKGNLSTEPHKFPATWLLQKARDQSFSVQILSTRLLWIFISDRKSASTHDDFSRAFWRAVDTNILEKCMEITLEYASTNDAEQPILLTLLDLLDSLFQVVENCDFVLSQLGAQSLEKLIYLVKPKEIKFDFADMFDSDLENDSNTPNAHNLSRLDEKSICIEKEEEKEARGLDKTVRLAAATALSRLGYHSSLPSNESICLLISRICTAVNDFFANFHGIDNDESREEILSFDVSRRSFLLQHALATPENEAFVTSILFAKQSHHEQMFLRLQQENASKERKLIEASKKEGQLKMEKKKYLQKCQSHATVLQRELAKVKSNATQDARQLVALHVSERTSAESRALQFKRSIEESELKLQEIKRKAEESANAEAKTKEELQIACSKLADLQKESEDLRHLVHEETVKSKGLEETLSARMEEFTSANHKLEGEIRHVKDDNKNLLNNLEDLFADMVSIAQIYQIKEKEEDSKFEMKNNKIEELHGIVSLEKKKNEKMTENLESLKTENEKLFKKYTKYKERLGEERRDRQDETMRRKRNGPVSYINQLHDSQKSSRNDSGYEKSQRSRSQLGKENRYYDAATSSQQQRRKHIK